MLTICTAMSAKGLEDYGLRFLDSFAEYWPRNVRLEVFSEDAAKIEKLVLSTSRRIDLYDLTQDVYFQLFMRRHASDPAAKGQTPRSSWRRKDHEQGYSFRTDAVKFAHKVFAISSASTHVMPSGVLAWLDADVVTTKSVPSGLVEHLLGDAACAYLGRDGVHSECGFVAFSIPEARPLISEWMNLYYSGDVFSLKEWHDSFVFDYARSLRPDIACKNLTPGGSGHVWCDSPLAPYTDHLKGDRKAMGQSPERRVS